MAGPKNAAGLTPKEEAFAEARAGGKTLAEAYDAAGYSRLSQKNKKMNGYKVACRPAVKKRIAELQEQVESGAILNVEQIQAELTNMSLDEKNSKNVRLKALDQLAKTKGAYSDNINVNASGGLTIADKKEAFKELVGE